MSCRGFDPVCTNNEARKYFADKGLTYEDIELTDVHVLKAFLKQEYKKSNKVGETSVNTERVSDSVYARYGEKSIIYCFLYVNSHYFKQRECISFNQDGFIGFAGWADQGNVNPILRAFLRWCDVMAEKKEKENATHENG